MGSFISRAMARSPLPPTVTDSNFARLPPEILASILERLSLVDRIRFGCVCSSFLSAFRDQVQCTISSSLSTPPWLLLPNESTDTNIAFFSITETKMYKIPQSSAPSYSNHVWLGSSQGWLVAMDEGTSIIYLSNPVTRSRIQLPALVTADSSHEPLCLEFSRAILSWNYSSSSSLEKGYAVVLLLAWPSSNWPSTMLCACDGDKAWIPFGSTKDVYIDASFHNGQFYTTQANGMVEAWSLSTGGTSTPSMTVIMPRQLSLSSTRYLVSSDDDILQVCRSSPDLSKIEFKIFKLDMSNKEWVEMESLGDRVLILNGYCSMSVSSRTCPDQFGGIIFDRVTPGKSRETLLLKMEDKSLKKVLDGPYWNKSPIWITPSLL